MASRTPSSLVRRRRGTSSAAPRGAKLLKADPTGLTFVFVLNSFGDSPTRFRHKDKSQAIGHSYGEGGAPCVWSYVSDSCVKFNPGGTSHVDPLRRGVAGFVSDIRKLEVDSFEVWGAAGPPTPGA